MTAALQQGNWTAKPEVISDHVDLMRARAMQASLDLEERAFEIGDTLPPLWHWLYFWKVAPDHALGPDGHPERGGFLPPVAQARRMWAGGRLIFHRPIPLGVRAERRSEVTRIEEKQGRSGPLTFVTATHTISVNGIAAVTEEQDIVYRQPAAGAFERPPGKPPQAEPRWQREFCVDPVLLFRYSALTFNGHRIHYDADYARDEEGYPGLVVHGPLLATLALELFRAHNPRALVTGYRFRALRPIFAGEGFTAAGAADGGLWIIDSEGLVAMEAEAESES